MSGEPAGAFQAWVLPPGAPDPSRITLGTGEDEEMALRHPVLSGEEMAALCASLRQARDRILLGRSTESLIEALGGVAERFLDPADELRAEAMELLVGNAGLSPAMSWEVLDGMARDWTGDRLRALVAAELPDPAVLEGFRPGPGGGRVRALGPGLLLHFGAGNVPGVGVTSLLRGLLVRSAVLVKPGRGDVVLPVLFARGLARADPELARALAVVYWPGGTGMGEDAALAAADHVVLHGGDDTVRSVRDRLPPTTPLTAYHHRVGVALVGRGALTGEAQARAVARTAARAVALFDQRGCVSPHLFWVERGGDVSPAGWAALLGEALEAVSGELPPGRLAPEEASAIQQLRGSAEMRQAAGEGVELHQADDLSWTVVFDPRPQFQAACPGRVVRVKPVEDLGEAARHLEGNPRVLQTVGLAGADDRMESVAAALARAGASRITSLERVPWPPPWWHHDGLGPLRTLIRWVDLEGEG